MIFIKIPTPLNLPKRWSTIYSERMGKLGDCATHDLRSAYLKKNNSWVRLRNWLASVSSQKCWYCEAKSPKATFDVDHFRPKLGITVNRKTLAGHDGYYWLAYEWSNFRLSCQRCNRPEKNNSEELFGKANEFPVQNEAQRCSSPTGSLATESPMLLDPCVQADCDLLAHGIDGEVKPIEPEGSWGYTRAEYTIRIFGLNQWEVPKRKRDKWQTLNLLINLVGDSKNDEVVDAIKKHLSCDHEYTGFFRAAIGVHRDKFWINDLLYG